MDYRFTSVRMMAGLGGIVRDDKLFEDEEEVEKKESLDVGSLVMTKAFFLFMVAAGSVQIYVTIDLILTGVQAGDDSAEGIVAYLVALYLCMSDFTQFEQFVSETYFYTDSSRTKVWNLEGGVGQLNAAAQGVTYESLTVVLLVELLLLSIQAYLSFGDDVNFVLTLIELGLTLFKILEFSYKRYQMWKKNPSQSVKVCGYVIIFVAFVLLLPFVFLVSFLNVFILRVCQYSKALYLIIFFSPFANCDDSTDLIGLADAI